MSTRRFMGNTTAYVVLGLAVFAMTFFGVVSFDGNTARGPSGAAANVAGHEISYNEFRSAYDREMNRYQRIYSDGFDPSTVQLARNVLNQLVDERVVFIQADRAGIFVPKDEIEKQIVNLFKDEKGQFSGQRFENYLRYYGWTEKSFFDVIQRDMVNGRYRQFLGQTSYVSGRAAEIDYRLAETKLNLDYLQITDRTATPTVSNAEITAFLNEDGQAKVKDYYDKNNADYNKPKRVRARHILVAHKDAQRATGAAKKRSKEQAKQRAEQLLVKVKAKGANFAAIAKQETDEPSGKTKGGDLGFFAKEDMAEAFSEAAFSMSRFSVSDVVETPFGFHIIRVEDIQPAKQQTLEQATNSIARKLIEQTKRPELADKLASDVLAAAQTKSERSLLKKHGLAWKETKEFGADVQYIPGLGSDADLRAAVFSMQKPGETYGSVVTSGNNRYILRLKSRQQPDMSKFDDEKREELGRNAAYGLASSLYTSMKDRIEKKLRDDGRIDLNESFLALDQPRQPDSE